MTTILIDGHEVLIDDGDLSILELGSWWIDNKGYVAGSIAGRRSRLHQEIMAPPKGQLVDHRNRNRLDNRRENLRLTNRSGNAQNSKFRAHNTSGFRGVYYCRQTGKWRAEIQVNGKGIKLGRFASKEDAARAYDAAAVERHGEFAVVNFPCPQGFVHWKAFTTSGSSGEVGKGCEQ